MRNGAIDVVVGSVFTDISCWAGVSSNMSPTRASPASLFRLFWTVLFKQMILFSISRCFFGKLKSRRETLEFFADSRQHHHRLIFGRL